MFVKLENEQDLIQQDLKKFCVKIFGEDSFADCRISKITDNLYLIYGYDFGFEIYLSVSKDRVLLREQSEGDVGIEFIDKSFEDYLETETTKG